MKTFLVTATVYMTVEIDEKVFDESVGKKDEPGIVDDLTEKDVVQHLAYNALINQLNLTQLDGFAHLSDGMLRAHVDDTDFSRIEELKRA